MDSARLPHAASSGVACVVRAASFAVGIVLPWQEPRRWPVVLVPLALLAILPAGRRCRLFVPPLLLGVVLVATHRLVDPVPALLGAWEEHGFHAWTTPIEIEGRLIDTDTLTDGREALLLRATSFAIPGRPPFRSRPKGPIFVRLTVPAPGEGGTSTRRPGDLIEASARVGPPRTFRNPGAFDYASYLAARGIALIGTTKSAQLVRVVPGRTRGLAALPAIARGWLVSTLRRAAGEQDDTTVSFLAALLVGERDDLPPAFENHLIRAGVYHIVALSGFNVALVAGLVSALLRLLPLSPRARRVALALCVVLYWGVARPSGSIARAALMSLLCLGGAAMGRRVPATAAIATASVLILGFNPAWIFDPGFQLSFAATLGLLLLAPATRSAPEAFPWSRGGGGARIAGRRAKDWVVGSLSVSLAALASTSLITARHFQTLTPVALVANLFAVPISAVLLVTALVACLLDPMLHSAAGALLVLGRCLVDLLDFASAAAAGPSWCSFFVLPPPVWLVLLGQCAVVLALFGRAFLKRAALLFLALSIILTAVRGRSPASTGRLELIALDVGQGDALLVRFPGGATMLIDAGGLARTRFDIGSKVVAPALRSLGLFDIDVLALTHAHRDHLGGAAAILRDFSPGAVWLGRMPAGDPAVEEIERLAEGARAAVVLPRRGARITLGGARVEVLNPGRGVDGAGPARNDDSLVLRLSFGGRSVLLTGDLESPLETILVDEGRDLSADLLKVGHHGSRTSTSRPFLGRVHPSLGVISVGTANPWGHPDEEILGRLRDAGVEVYRTDRDGAVRFSTDGASPWGASRLVEEGRP